MNIPSVGPAAYRPYSRAIRFIDGFDPVFFYFKFARDHETPDTRCGMRLGFFNGYDPDNVQLLCGKHNLEKHDRIE